MATINKHAWVKFHISHRDVVDNRYSLYQDRQMKEYDKIISSQVTKFVREQNNFEEKALVLQQLEQSILLASKQHYAKDRQAQTMLEQEYETDLFCTWTGQLPS